MTGFNGIIVNGKLMQNSSDFSKLIRDQITKDFASQKRQYKKH
jgi:hypothetical protein